MYPIFECVILVFSKHSKSCKSANQEHPKNYEDSSQQRMEIQEVSEDLQMGGIMFPSLEASYLKTKT